MATRKLKKTRRPAKESTAQQLKNIGELYVLRTKDHLVENKEFYTGMGTAGAAYGAYELVSNLI